jgi:N-acetylmuramoyl-L-alanine amidase
MHIFIQRLKAVAIATIGTAWASSAIAIPMNSTAQAPAAPAAPSLPENPLTTPIVPGVVISFSQQEVDQSRFIAIAAPYAGGTAHQLLVLEQIKNDRPCWNVLGGTPTIIDPVLRTFNFTGICGRSIDANGYSIRANGEDMGRKYSLRIIRRNQNLVLVGNPIDCFNPDRSKCTNPEFEIGHTNGITTDYAQINLNPGWRFSRRVLGDRPLGHIYLTYEGAFPPTVVAATPPPPTPPPSPGALTFRDVGGDIYATEIQQAVQLGVIAGFEDGSFRPQSSLTREQLVSMALESLKRLPGVTLTLPTAASASPYSDVAANRWSAAKIEFAQRNNIVSGYEDGSFRPMQPVTRAEMMAILRRTAEYGRSLRRLSPSLPPSQAATSFTDTTGHWAEALISQMSGYCKVASPLNETGTNFAPNSEAQRNYAAAATLRMYNCVAQARQ